MTESLLERLKTFKKTEYYTPLIYALVGFRVFEKPFALQCVFCDKILEGWESEHPLEEHLDHPNNCYNLKLSLIKNRLQSYPEFFSAELTKIFSKNNFFFYRLKEEISTIFCYICGHEASEKDENIDKINKRNVFKSNLFKSAEHECVKNGDYFSNRFMVTDILHERINFMLKPKYVLTETDKKEIKECAMFRGFLLNEDRDKNLKEVLKKYTNKLFEIYEEKMKESYNENVEDNLEAFEKENFKR